MNRTEVLAGIRTFNIWRGVFSRCTNPKANGYANYGGRGIVICERWKRFDNFLDDMGLAPEDQSLDRINTGGNYEPGNCRWATRLEQANNKRRNLSVTLNGKTLTLAEWSRKLNIPRTTLVRRYNDGKSPEEILQRQHHDPDIETATRARVAKRRSATHCKHGHQFTQANTRVHANGTRHCIECGRTRARDHYRKKAGAPGR